MQAFIRAASGIEALEGEGTERLRRRECRRMYRRPDRGVGRKERVGQVKGGAVFPRFVA
jgi:hypothetical protein